MNKKQIAITLGIMCFILTIAISIQLKTIKNTNTTVSQSLKENSLRDEVLKWKEKYDNIYGEFDESSKELESIRKIATQDNVTSAAKQEEITQNNMLLGLYDVHGPGLEITLADNNTGILKDGTQALRLEDLLIHDISIIKIINNLNNAGAEAISVNGQRIVQTTSITCEGNVTKLNGQRLSSPITIKAIGSPNTLYGAITMIGGYYDSIRDSEIIKDIKQMEDITVEKYDGVINYKYIRSEK